MERVQMCSNTGNLVLKKQDTFMKLSN